MAPSVSIAAGGFRRQRLDDRNHLVESHLALVPPIARRVKKRLPPSFDLDDLISEGQIGLVHAATRYQPQSHNGTPFSAYARPRIHGAIVDSVRRRAWLENTGNPLEDAPEQSASRRQPVMIRGPQLPTPRRRQGMPPCAFRMDHLPKPLARALQELTARQRTILGAVYGEAETHLPDLASDLHLTVDQVVEEHRRALAILTVRFARNARRNVSRSGLTLVFLSQRPGSRAA